MSGRYLQIEVNASSNMRNIYANMTNTNEKRMLRLDKHADVDEYTPLRLDKHAVVDEYTALSPEWSTSIELSARCDPECQGCCKGVLR